MQIIVKQKGFSLIELMISMAVGLVLTSGVISMFTGSLKNTNEFVSLTKLDQDLQGVMELIASEIRRTGYDGDSTVGGDTDFGVDSNSTSSCILYSYDDDNSGNVGQLDSNEKYGIRLTNKVVYFGTSVTNCSAGSWNAVNDVNTIEISDLTFTYSDLCLNLVDNSDCTTTTPNSGDKLLWKKQIQVSITGNYTNDSNNFSRTISNTVRLYNDVLKTYP